MRQRSMIADHPINTPPRSNILLTPNDPKLSNLPYPNGNLVLGGLSANEIVARVIKSLTRSVKECTASARSAVFVISAFEFQWPSRGIRPHLDYGRHNRQCLSRQPFQDLRIDQFA